MWIEWYRIKLFLLIIFLSIAVSIIEERERWRRDSGIGYAPKDIPDRPGNIRLHGVTKATQTNIMRSGSYISIWYTNQLRSVSWGYYVTILIIWATIPILQKRNVRDRKETLFSEGRTFDRWVRRHESCSQMRGIILFLLPSELYKVSYLSNFVSPVKIPPSALIFFSRSLLFSKICMKNDLIVVMQTC